jgi:flagellar biosynthesis regulator FlaF
MTYTAATLFSHALAPLISVLPDAAALPSTPLDGFSAVNLRGSPFAYEAAGLFSRDRNTTAPLRWTAQAPQNITRDNASAFPRLIADIEALESNAGHKQDPGFMGAIDLFLLTRSEAFATHVTEDGGLTEAGKRYLQGLRLKEKMRTAFELANREEAQTHIKIKTLSDILRDMPASPPETVGELTSSLHALLSRLMPTRTTQFYISFDHICLLDGTSVTAEISRDYDDGAFKGIAVWNNRQGTWLYTTGLMRAVLLHPAEKTQENSLPGTQAFDFVQRAWGALVERLKASDAAAERELRAYAAGLENETKVDVPRSVLMSEDIERNANRVRKIEAASAALQPLATIPETDFVQLIAKLLKHLRSHSKTFTGTETTWAAIREHFGVGLDSMLSSNPLHRTIDDVVYIDLKASAKMAGGYVPFSIRDFRLELVPDKDTGAMRFTFYAGKNLERVWNDVTFTLGLYRTIVDAGYPVVLDPSFRRVALGEDTLKVERNDPRIPSDSPYRLTAETVPIAIPLADNAPDSIPRIG